MIGLEYLFDSVITTVLLGVTSLILFYWYSTKNFDYWKKKGITYEKPVPFFGTTLEYLWKPFHEIEKERYLRLGPIYGHFEGNAPVLSVAEPRLLREIMVKEFSSISNRRFVNLRGGNPVADATLPVLSGEAWRRVRNIVSPTFTTGKIKRMMSIVKDCSKGVVDNFKKFSTKGRPLDVKRMYGAFTMDVIASAAFSTKLDSLNDPENEFVKAAKNAFSTDFSWRVALFQLFPNLMTWLRVAIFPPEPMNFFKRVTLRIIEERKKTGQTRNDFLQLLIDTAKENPQDQKPEEDKNEDTTSTFEVDEKILPPTRNAIAKNLSEDELVAQCVIFFLAGYDTTATALSYASYLLALNPEIQHKLFTELRDAMQETKVILGEPYSNPRNEIPDNVVAETQEYFRLQLGASLTFKFNAMHSSKTAVDCTTGIGLCGLPKNSCSDELWVVGGRSTPQIFHIENDPDRDRWSFDHTSVWSSSKSVVPGVEQLSSGRGPRISSRQLERVADTDLKLADTGITIPKGMIVTISNYALQHDPQFFPNPDVFDPDSKDIKKLLCDHEVTAKPVVVRGRAAPSEILRLFTFRWGRGPNGILVGMRFALMEIKVCLVYIVANFKLQRCPLTKVPLDFHLGPGLLIPYKGIQLKAEHREDRILLK
ncbi:cytochrome P450 3A9 [Trichonephila inaurata madagascariensis]|uniref:Cytochrome P450 3A9 n=1 Tax=Trichonephila inaurata madagascariensis TaxID=2747483 RepID=A0A8X6WXH9_9ARAC|nr:cytochrome P450 3A9 [Trichonephila inaurata madagascariensis]